MSRVRADETSSNGAAALVSEGRDKGDNANPTAAAERQSNENHQIKEHTFDHKQDTDARTDTQALFDAKKTPLPPDEEISATEAPSAKRQSSWNTRAEGKTKEQKNDTNARPGMQGLVQASQTPLPAEKDQWAAEDPSIEHQSNGNDPSAGQDSQALADAYKTPLPEGKETLSAEDPSGQAPLPVPQKQSAAEDASAAHQSNSHGPNARPDSQVQANAGKTPLPPGKDNSKAEGPPADTVDKYEITGARQAHPNRKAERSSFYEGSGASTQDKRYNESVVNPLSKDTAMTPGTFPDDDGESVYSEVSLNDKAVQEPASANEYGRDDSPVDHEKEDHDKQVSLKQSQGTSLKHPISEGAHEPKRRSFSPGPAKSSFSSDAEPSQERDSEPSWSNEEGESESVQNPIKASPAGEVSKSVESLPKEPPRRSVTASSPLGKADTDKPPTLLERLRAPFENYALAKTTESPEDSAPRQKVSVSTQGPVESTPKRSPRRSVTASSPSGKADIEKPLISSERLWVPIGDYASGETVDSPENTAPRESVNDSTQNPTAPKPSSSSAGATERAKANDPSITSSAAVAQAVDRRASEIPVHHIRRSKDNNQGALSNPPADSPDVARFAKAGHPFDGNHSLPKDEDNNQDPNSQLPADSRDVVGVSKVDQDVHTRPSLPEVKDETREVTPDPRGDSPKVTGDSKAGQPIDKNHSLPEETGGNQGTISNPLVEKAAVTRFSKARQEANDQISLPQGKDSDEEAGQLNGNQPPELKRSETQAIDMMKRFSVPRSIYARDQDGDEEAGQQSETQPPELKRSETKPVDIMDRISVPPSINSRRGSKAAKKVTLPPPKIFVQSPSEATPLDDDIAEPHPTPAGHLPNDEYRITSRNGSIVSIQHTIHSAAEKLGSPPVKKRKLYLRKARNLAARRILLNAVLGRKMGGRTKDKLQRLARGEEVPNTPVSTQPQAADSPSLKKRSSVIRKLRNVASRQSLLDVALGRQVGRETKPVLRRMAKGENIVVEEA